MKRYSAQIIATAIAMALILPFCDLAFGCGCTITGLKHCNIHNPAPPNCPWCSGSLLVQLVPMITIGLAAMGGPFLFRRLSRRSRFLIELPIGLVSALIAGVLLAWIYALAWSYPNFFLFGSSM